MKLSDLKDELIEKMSFRDELLADENFVIRAEAGIRKISQKTLPMGLIDSDPNGQEVLRHPLPHTYVLVHPKFDRTLTNGEVDLEQELLLEAELVDGVASYMATKYEPQNKQAFFAEMWDAINNHRKMIMDSPFLSEAEEEYQHGYV